MNYRIVLSIFLTVFAMHPVQCETIGPKTLQETYKNDSLNFDFLIAIDRGDLTGVKRCIARGANVNEKIGLDHESALHFALVCLKNEAYKQKNIRELRLAVAKTIGSAAVLGGCVYAAHYAVQQMLTKNQDTDGLIQQLANTFTNIRDHGNMMGVGKRAILGFFGGLFVVGVADQTVRFGLPHLATVIKTPSHYWNLLSRLCIIDEILFQENIERDAVVSALAMVKVWQEDPENSKELMKNIYRRLEKALKCPEQVAAEKAAKKIAA
jgi:hypothetical protein